MRGSKNKAMMVVAFCLRRHYSRFPARRIEGSPAARMRSGAGLGIGGDTDWMEWKNVPKVRRRAVLRIAKMTMRISGMECMDDCEAKNQASVDARQATRFASSSKSPIADEGVRDTAPYSRFPSGL
uniref:Uncharacterized protein n=1 Tax=Amphimedon queenslandica TaxID=400682 RepID=A0A1X7SMJ5_AMPQE